MIPIKDLEGVFGYLGRPTTSQADDSPTYLFPLWLGSASLRAVYLVESPLSVLLMAEIFASREDFRSTVGRPPWSASDPLVALGLRLTALRGLLLWTFGWSRICFKLLPKD